MLTKLSPPTPYTSNITMPKNKILMRGEPTHRSQNHKLIKSCQNDKILKYHNAVKKTNVEKYVEYLYVELDTT